LIFLTIKNIKHMVAGWIWLTGCSLQTFALRQAIPKLYYVFGSLGEFLKLSMLKLH
jgi:hypothetical protein